MTRSCACYATDPTYLLPTFVSAVQARGAISPVKADVIIICLGADGATEQAFQNSCNAEGIRFLRASSESIDGAHPMMARLFLARLLPTNYQHLLYIDGDTQIRGALDALIEAPVPAGCFMAAPDPMTFELGKGGRRNQRVVDHFASIGIAPKQTHRYFNSGVLRINRDGWDEIGQAAWALVRQSRQQKLPLRSWIRTR